MRDVPASASPQFAVAIDGEGLRLVAMETGRTTPLPFGTEQSVLLDALTRTWGPWRERSDLPDCAVDPPTIVSWNNGLSVVLQDDRFVGWSARAPRPEGSAAAPGTVETMAGIGIGSARGELEDVYEVHVSTTSLGAEFDAGDLYGLFADTTAGAAITALWAGRVCIFR